MTVFEQIRKLLEENHIAYHLSEHEKVRTSAQAAAVRGGDAKTGAKAMVAKANDTFILCVLPGNCFIDWKKVKSYLGVKRIRLATEEEAENLTHVEMGSVPPFGNVLGLATYMDPKVLENEWINFNPGSRVHTIQMRSSDLVKLVEPVMVSITGV